MRAMSANNQNKYQIAVVLGIVTKQTQMQRVIPYFGACDVCTTTRSNLCQAAVVLAFLTKQHKRNTSNLTVVLAMSSKQHTNQHIQNQGGAKDSDKRKYKRNASHLTLVLAMPAKRQQPMCLKSLWC